MKPLLPDEIIATVARMMRTTPADILSPTRREPVRTARAICAYLMRRDIVFMTYREISETLGRRDHATAINSVRRVEDLLESRCPKIREIIEAFELAVSETEADPDQLEFHWMLTTARFPRVIHKENHA